MIRQTSIKSFFGVSIIIIICWIRFITKRESVNIDEIIPSTTQIIVKGLLIIFFSILLYLNIRKLLLLNSKIQIQNYKFFEKFMILIKEYFSESPAFFYRKITLNKDYDLVLDKLANKITYYNPKYIIICLIIVPQMIIATTLVIDVTYFNQLKYFFISLNLLILVLIIRILPFIFEVLSERRAYHLEQYLTIEKVDDGFKFNYKKELPSKQSFSLLPNDGQEFPRISLIVPELQVKNQIPLILTSDWLIPLGKSWYYYRYIYDYMIHFRYLIQKYTSYMQIYTTLCYIIGWSYYLFLIL